MAKQDRFEILNKEGNALTNAQRMLLKDRETGVCYLFIQAGYAGGLAPLLDTDGKPVITR